MTFLTDHLKSRHLDFDLHKPVLDEENNVATFYLWNLSNRLTGYLQYRPLGDKKADNNKETGKYYHYHSDPSACLSLFGTESLYLTPNVLFLTEGVFDAARLTEKGCSALALLACDSNANLTNYLYLLKHCTNRKVVAVCDNDKPGKKLAKFGDFAEVCESHDLGDSSDEYVEWLVNKYA